MKGNDAVLALLQDIKDLLYGIGLLIIAGLFSIVGVLMLDGIGLLFLFIGILLLVCGVLHLHRGYHHHEVIAHPESAEE